MWAVLDLISTVSWLVVVLFLNSLYCFIRKPFFKSLYSFSLLKFQIGSDSAQSLPAESMKTSLHYDMVSWYIRYVPPCKFRVFLMHIFCPLTIFDAYAESSLNGLTDSSAV